MGRPCSSSRRCSEDKHAALLRFPAQDLVKVPCSGPARRPAGTLTMPSFAVVGGSSFASLAAAT